jgi:hypothetical protein
MSLAVLSLFAPGLALAQEEDARIRVKDERTGKPTGLFRKVIVATDGVTFHPGKPEAAPKPVSSFSIFHHLYTDDKKTAEFLEKDGKLMLRVGKRDGSPIGWLKVAKPADPTKELSPDLIVWNTRFMLQPHLNPNKERFSIFADDKCKDALAKVTVDEVPKNHKAQAAIIDRSGKDSESTYKVAFFAGKPGTGAPAAGGSVVSSEANKIEDLKLEIVFVIDTTRSMTPLIEGTKEVVKRCVEQLGKMPELNGQVKFGLVEYQDVAPGLFTSRLDSALTADYQTFIKDKLAPVKEATTGSADTPEDVLAGLKAAVTDSGWGANSSRHIILIGDASAHIGANRCSPACAHEHDPKTGACSGNSSGLDIKRIIDLGRPSAGTTSDRALRSITFSAVRIKGEDPTDHDSCRQQFQELAHNNGQAEGKYLDVEDPNREEDRQKAVKELTDFLLSGFSTLQKVRAAGGNKSQLRQLTEGTPTNAVSASIFKIVKTQIGDVKPVHYGFAVETTEKGDQVAETTIQVEKGELDELRSTMDFLLTKFQSKADPAKRKNVSELLDILKQATTGTVAGQQVKADTNLAEVITSLPVTTKALNISAEKIGRMPEKEFLGWLEEIKATKKRSEDLMASKDWDDVSDGNSDERYLFLRKTEMP